MAKEKKVVSGIFPGAVFNLYYFESQGEIYGEYHPKIWENAYGVVVNVKQDGTIYAVKDTSERTGKKVTGNDMIEILALQDGKMIGYWHDCNWSRNGGISSVLWVYRFPWMFRQKRELKQWKRSKKRKQGPA